MGAGVVALQIAACRQITPHSINRLGTQLGIETAAHNQIAIVFEKRNFIFAERWGTHALTPLFGV